jgi:hypothetical protein
LDLGFKSLLKSPIDIIEWIHSFSPKVLNLNRSS